MINSGGVILFNRGCGSFFALTRRQEPLLS